jgi:NAD(P)-dependent dehydrogenase (short-subunit alcohol dehydrogenase family)
VDVVFITGASSGIGAAAARAFAASGAGVGLMARDPDRLAALAAEVGDAAVALPGNVIDPGEVTRSLDRPEAEAGSATCVVNCAGVCVPVALERDRGGGAIVNVGSELGALGAPGYVAYCASKAGVLGLTRALAVELAPSVRVNAVCPGPVDTPMLDHEFALSEDALQARAHTERRVPLGRIASPAEIASAIVFLSGSTYASGAALALDGGSTIVA